MQKLPHERMALIECGFVTIFFEPQWNNWKFHRKCALLLHWWPLVIKTIKTAPPSSFWAIPCDWPSDGNLRSLPTSDKKLLKIQRQIAARDTVRKRRSVAKVDSAQSDLEFEKASK